MYVCMLYAWKVTTSSYHNLNSQCVCIARITVYTWFECLYVFKANIYTNPDGQTMKTKAALIKDCIPILNHTVGYYCRSTAFKLRCDNQ